MVKLKNLRLMKKLKQSDIALMLEITPQAYGHYENGSRKPSPEMLCKMADVFNVSVDYLLDRENQGLFDNSKISIVDDREIVRLYDKMTDHQQKCLVNYARGMLASSSSQSEQNYKLRKNY